MMAEKISDLDPNYSYTDDRFTKFRDKGKQFFEYVEGGNSKLSLKKSMSFGKRGKVKKSFKGEGLKL